MPLILAYVFWIIVLKKPVQYVHNGHHIQYQECNKKLCQGPRCSQLIPGYLENYKTEMFILRDVQLAKYILFGINTYSKEKFFQKELFWNFTDSTSKPD